MNNAPHYISCLLNSSKSDTNKYIHRAEVADKAIEKIIYNHVSIFNPIAHFILLHFL